MRIALVLPSLAGGGAERVMLRIARDLVERGHDVTLVTFAAGGDYEHLVPPGVEVNVLGCNKGRRCLWALVKYFRRAHPEAILSTLIVTNILSVWARRLAGLKARLVLRETIHLSAYASQQPDLKWRILPWLASRVYRYADVVVANADAMKDDLAELGIPADKLRVIHNPVVEPELLALAKENVDHPWVGRHPLVLGVGRLVPQKGFDVLLSAVSQLDPVPYTVILGQGPDREALLEQARRLGIQDRVELPGFVHNPFPWMAAADVVALTSRSEGMPNVLIQAMGIGTPVVATDCPSGPRELLRGAMAEWLVAVDNAQDLAERLALALERHPLAAALQEVADRFDARACLDAYAMALRGP